MGLRTRLALGALAAAVAVVALGGYRGRASVRRELVALRRIGERRLGDVRCLLDPERETLAISAGELTLRADLYRPHGADAAPPGIVLLHGASPHGRRLPLYPVLAELLAQRGHAVLAVDSRGFGESQDPSSLDDPRHWDFAADVPPAIDSLVARAGVDPSRIYVVGHSFGAGIGLAASARDRRIARVVLIGPTRRLTERFLRAGAPDSAYYLERWRRDMGLTRQITYDTWRSILEPLNIENWASEDGYTAAVPLLLVDGSREDPRDLDSLRAVAARMRPPPDYLTVDGTDHYLHTGRLLNEEHRWAPPSARSVACYNRRVTVHFADQLTGWLAGSAR